MIRDPSDGSMRETPKSEPGIPASKPIIDSGLREASQKADRQARLEKSREWLKDYFAKKGAKGGATETV